MKPWSSKLAMERIGAYLIVSGPLYSHAIDALGGDKSVRFAHAKLLGGLSSGGVATQLRHSSVGVKTFLLAAALKGCMFDDGGIGQFLYDFMDVQDILHHQPASIRQLQSVISVLSSNCEHLIPSTTDTHLELVRKLTDEAKEDWTGQYFGILEHKEMATLLVQAFGAMQDRNTSHVEFTGVYGLVWLASLLLWIDPEEVGLFCWDQHLVGAANGKVRIEIDATHVPAAEDAGWKVRTWRAGNWTEMIVPVVKILERFDHCRARDMVPGQSVRHFFLDRDSDAHDQKIAIIGGMAAGLVDVALKLGRVA